MEYLRSAFYSLLMVELLNCHIDFHKILIVNNFQYSNMTIQRFLMYDVHVLKSCHENTKALNFTKLCAGFVP